MRVEGGCHCGKITFEAEIDPATASICHCTDCQTLSGSAYRSNVRTVPGGFKLLTGQPKTYVKTAESGTKRAQGFCADCGTPIYSTSVTDPKIHGLRIGTLRQRNDLRPKMQGWCRSAQTWVADLSAMARHEKQPGR